jgi:hypothetical protein
MAARVCMPLRVIAFNANGIWRQCYKLSKQLQDFHKCGSALRDTLKPHVRLFIPNYHFYRTGLKSPGHTWNDADIIELLSFRHKLPLAGDLNAKHPLRNSVFSNPSGMKLLNLI